MPPHTLHSLLKLIIGLALIALFSAAVIYFGGPFPEIDDSQTVARP